MLTSTQNRLAVGERDSLLLSRRKMMRLKAGMTRLMLGQLTPRVSKLRSGSQTGMQTRLARRDAPIVETA